MDDKKLASELTSQFQQLKNIRSPYEQVWEDIGKYVYLDQCVTELNDSQRAERSTVIYDGTAVAAHDLMVNGLLGYLISRVTQWMKLYHADQEIMDYPEVREYFQDAEVALYGEFERSNFYEQIKTAFDNGGSFGTAGIHIEEDVYNSRINYLARPAKELYVAENKYGYVDTIFRHYYMTTKQIVEAFKKDKLEERWIKENEKTPYKKHEMLHIVRPRKNRDVTRIDNENKPFESVYMFKAGDILRVSGYDTLPDVVWRWSKNADEEYGRSPAWKALTDIKRINRISKDLMSLSNYQVNPAVMYPGSMEYMMNLNPGGRIPYTDPNMLIKPIEKGNYPIGRDREEKIEEAIRQHFHVDFFMSLSQVTKTMTIPEVMERQGEKGAVLGTTVGRINSELLDPIIEKTFEIADRAGRMPEVPQVLIDYGGEIKIEYTGLLAQIQRRYMGTQGITRAMEQLAPMVQMNPEILDNINFDEMARELMVKSSMPQKIIRSEDEVMKIRQARAKQAQDAANMQKVEAMGKAAGGLNQQVEEGSMLDDLNKTMASAVNGGQ